MDTNYAKYKPNSVDIQWAKNMLSVVKNGGKWVAPATNLVYVVDHTNKQLILENPGQLAASFESFVLHMQTIQVFNAIG